MARIVLWLFLISGILSPLGCSRNDSPCDLKFRDVKVGMKESDIKKKFGAPAAILTIEKSSAADWHMDAEEIATMFPHFNKVRLLIYDCSDPRGISCFLYFEPGGNLLVKATGIQSLKKNIK